MKRNRPFILTGLALMALVGLVLVARPAPASPPSVDNVVNVIRANIEAGKWSLAARNIEALDRTIYDELQVKNRPVVIDSNPVQDRLGEVGQRLRLLKADYRILDDAQSRIDRASVRRANVLTVQIGIELVKKLNLINARAVIDAVDAFDGDGARRIASTVRDLRRGNEAVTYFASLLSDLRPAIQESQNERTQLLELNRAFTAVLGKYALTVSTPSPDPAAEHPRIAGTWLEVGGPNSCPRGLITFTQAANGDVTSATDDLSACSGAWRAFNIRWLSQYVLAYDYTVTRRPAGWTDGSHQITFTPDGRSGTLVWQDQSGNSDTNTVTKQG